MKNYAGTICLLLLAVGCTPSQKNSGDAKQAGNPAKSQEILPFDSEFQFVHGTLASPDSAAEIKGEPVSWSQLTSNEPALQELEQRWMESAIEFTNQIVDDLLAQKKLPQGQATVRLYFAKPEKEGDFEALGVRNTETITTDFVGNTQPGLVATVGDLKITESDILKTSLDKLKLFENLYTQRMRRLNGIAVRRLLLSASRDAKLGMESYVQNKILGAQTDITDDMVADYAQKSGIAESDIDEKMTEKLRAIVSQKSRDQKIEAFAAKNLISEPILVAFRAPSRSLKMPKLSDSVPYWGQPDGKPLVYVGHWSCERCKDSLEFFMEGKERFGKNVRGIFLYSFPERDREARMSAEAGLCLHNQKPEYFWSFVAASMKEENPNSEAAINAAATASGADYEAFRKCFLAREYEKTVANQLAMVAKMGVQRPPMMALEGEVYRELSNFKPLLAALGTDSVTVGTTQQASKGSFLSRIWSFITNIF